jgi:hypothetical protein
MLEKADPDDQAQWHRAPAGWKRQWRHQEFLKK